MNYYMADTIVERLYKDGIISDCIPGSKTREVLIKNKKKKE